MKLRHLSKRLAGSVTARPLSDAEVRLVETVLLPVERPLFAALSRADQRHAVLVLERFDRILPSAAVEARRAALLHDVGKSVSGLGTLARVVATLVGPRSRRYADYHAHEVLGALLLERAGSHATTVALLRSDGEATILDALRRADDV